MNRSEVPKFLSCDTRHRITASDVPRCGFINPTGRGPEQVIHMRKFLRWTVTGTLVLVLALLATPFLVPMDRYKPGVEAALSHLMKQQIMIGRLSLEILPGAGLKAQGISVWSKEAGRGEAFVNTMHLEFDLPRLLFEGIAIIRDIKMEGLATNQRFLETLIGELHRHGPGDAAFMRLERISARSATIRLNDGRMLGPYRFDAILTPGNTIHWARLMRMDKKARIRILRRAEGYDFKLAARDWSPPLGPGLHFQALKTRGALDGQELRLTQIESQAYGGQLQGSARIGWRDGWRVTAQTAITGLSMEPVITLFGGRGFQGEFSGDLNIRLSARHLGKLLHDPVVKGTFTIDAGRVNHPQTRHTLFAFERFSAQGILRRDSLTTTNTRLVAHGGVVTGNTTTRWRPDWAFTADLQASDIDTVSLLGGFLDRKVIEGALSGQASVTLAGERFTEMFRRPTLVGRLQLADGVVHGGTGLLPESDPARFRFDGMRSDIELTPTLLKSRNLEIEAYGGRIRGATTLSRESGWRLEGQLTPDGLDSAALLEDTLQRRLVSGALSGETSFQFSGERFADLFRQPLVTGHLQLAEGTVYKPVHDSPLFSFEEIQSDFDLSATKLENRGITIAAYGGRISGSATLHWDPEWRLGAALEARDIDSAALLAHVADEKIISGEFSGRASLSLAGRTLARMLDNPAIEGRFHFRDGIFYKADLERAGVKSDPDAIADGQTPFHEFSGKTRIAQGTIEIDDIKLTSSAMQATGDISVDREQRLQGQLTLGIRKTAALTSVPMIVSGTTQAPHLRPSNSVLLGGVVGTTILGPGVGTAVGIKVGEGVEKFISAIAREERSQQP